MVECDFEYNLVVSKHEPKAISQVLVEPSADVSSAKSMTW